MSDHTLTADDVLRWLIYDPETGVFTRRVSIRGAHAGSVAGSRTHCGYWEIGVAKQRHLAHRLAWLIVHGTWPESEIDHINGDRLDNRIANLRDVSEAQNQQNTGVRCDNTSGQPGVFWDRGRWVARVKTNGKYMHLGRFLDFDEARRAYVEAKINLHPTWASGRGAREANRHVEIGLRS